MTTIKTYAMATNNETVVLEVKNDGHSHNSIRYNRTGRFDRIKKADLDELLADFVEVCDDFEPVQDVQVQENLDQDVPVFGETPEECNDMEQFICGILEQTFSLALVTEGGKFRYYVDETESDENANTILYRDGKLLSDNYFAYNSIVEEMEDIYTGKTEPDFISDTMKSAIRSMAENGYFDDDMEQSA